MHIIGNNTQNLGYQMGSLGKVRNSYQQNKGTQGGFGTGHGLVNWSAYRRPDTNERDAMRTRTFGSVIEQHKKPDLSNRTGWKTVNGKRQPLVDRRSGSGQMLHPAWQKGGYMHEDFRAKSWRPGGMAVRQWTLDPGVYGRKTLGNVNHLGWSQKNQNYSYNHPSAPGYRTAAGGTAIYRG